MFVPIPLLTAASILLAGCHTAKPARPNGSTSARARLSLARETEDRILALNPERVTHQDISEVLSNTPAPRVVNIHGGIYPVYLAMDSFSQFLAGMGYPEAAVRNPDGSSSFSCYESSDKIAGAIAWYYENEPLRPVIVGHSQGGIQAVKVLHHLAGHAAAKIAVWNPLTKRTEKRYEITEPLTGKPIPVIGLRLPYATAVGAGGFTRLLPNQWGMMSKLRKVPDSVEDFTGFYMGFDLFGGDFVGFGSANRYAANGQACVRNVRLPTGYNHVTVPSTKHLLKSQQIKDWINHYVPTDEPKLDVKFDSDSAHILWAADVWHSLKKHWVLELQRVIRAQRSRNECGLGNSGQMNSMFAERTRAAGLAPFLALQKRSGAGINCGRCLAVLCATAWSVLGMEPSKPTAHTVRALEGWTVRVDDRLLTPPNDVLGFGDPRIRQAYEQFRQSGHGDAALLFNGSRVRHYGLTDHKEFFAEMTESYFGLDDFFPFNRAELLTAEPEIYQLMQAIWGPVAAKADQPVSRTERAAVERPAESEAKRSESLPADSGWLTVDRIFGKEEFKTQEWGPARWLKDGSGYTTLEAVRDGQGGPGRRALRSGIGPARGAGVRLEPPGPRRIEAAEDRRLRLVRRRQKLLIFTNTKRVWRKETRGDYWVFDLQTPGAARSSAARPRRRRSCSPRSRRTAGASPTCARTTSSSSPSTTCGSRS